jgi:hypothetical protein
VERITVRDARPGDGDALARIHGEMGAYYAALAAAHFRVPDVDGFAAEIDAALRTSDEKAPHLVAELDDEERAANL